MADVVGNVAGRTGRTGFVDADCVVAGPVVARVVAGVVAAVVVAGCANARSHAPAMAADAISVKMANPVRLVRVMVRIPGRPARSAADNNPSQVQL
jgi:hypothetical protein